MSGAAAQAAPQQVAPSGMRRIPFPTESYQHASPPLSLKRLLNMYAEAQPDDARNAVALIPTPGLQRLVTAGTGPILAINTDLVGTIYCVSGTQFYRLFSENATTWTVTALGDVGTATGASGLINLQPTIALNPNAVVVCVPPNAFTCGHADTVVNQIGGDFPGAVSVTELDSYFVFPSPDPSDKFFISQINDPTSFDALDFAFADGFVNAIRGIFTLQRNLWVMGNHGNEVWYDSGDADFPFRRQPGGLIPFGVNSLKGIAIGDSSVFWISESGIVMRSNGLKAQRVSTEAIEAILQQLKYFNITAAFCYSQNGHIFYCVTYGSRTLVYDTNTQKWHDRETASGGAWLPICAGQWYGYPVLGSGVDGGIFTPVPGLDNDDGTVVRRQIIMPPLWAGTSRAFCSRLEIEMELNHASPTDLTLDWSDDGGFTWSGGARAMSATGGVKRAVTTRLGSFRQRTFRLTMHSLATVYAVDAAIAAGSGG